MTTILAMAEEYIAIRRSLGFKFVEGARLLRHFAASMDGEGQAWITVGAAVGWATTATLQPATCAARLGVVRRFALWLRAVDTRTEVPPERYLSSRYERRAPYLYTDDEIMRLMEAANRLPSPRGLRGTTYATLLGLLVVTGMRVGEALRLDREDVDFEDGVVTVRWTKFGKSRLVPLHPTTRDALVRYAANRDRILPLSMTGAFFVSEAGVRIRTAMADHTFAAVSRQTGLRPPTQGRRRGRGPRLHDFRHRFAVQTLINWYRTGVDVGREIPRLAAYLGHSEISHTYWYLDAAPELLQLAAERLTSERTGRQI